MKISYICECCDETVLETEIDDIMKDAGELAGLTEEERHDIIKMHLNGERVYVMSLCDDCSAGLGRDDDNDLLFMQEPLKH